MNINYDFYRLLMCLLLGTILHACCCFSWLYLRHGKSNFVSHTLLLSFSLNHHHLTPTQRDIICMCISMDAIKYSFKCVHMYKSYSITFLLLVYNSFFCVKIYYYYYWNQACKRMLYFFIVHLTLCVSFWWKFSWILNVVPEGTHPIVWLLLLFNRAKMEAGKI